MIRPEFRKILLDQRGAAVILWSAFAISIPIYLVIARKVLGNPKIGTNQAIAEPSRLIFWILTLVDLGYYAYWRRQNLTAAGDSARRAADQTVPRPGRIQRRRRRKRRLHGLDYVTRKVVIFAIIEAIAVYGFVLAFLGRFVTDQIALSLLSLILTRRRIPDLQKSSSTLVIDAAENPRVSISQVVDAPFAALGRIAQRAMKLFQEDSPGKFFGAQTQHMLGGHLRVDKAKTPAF